MPRLSATAWVVAALAAALLALLVFGLTAAGDDKSLDKAVQAGERPAAPAADRRLPVLGAAGERSLADYRGQVVVLNFWASWCKPCIDEAPELQKLDDRMRRERSGLVLGATYDDASSDSLQFMREHDIGYTSLRDVGTKLAAAFGTRALPETFVLDGEGRIVALSRGQTNEAFLRDAVARAKESD